MKFFNFHLMPYRHADLDAIGKNGSAWVTFSNRHYDPQKGAELYHEYLDQMEFADKLGFDGVCLNEHHQTAYGMMPIPGVLAGALARSVKRAKLAILGRALPLINNPLMVAEEYAILDNLTRGRLIAGFVRGSLAAPLPEAAPADLDSVSRLRLDHPLGRAHALHLLPDAEPHRGGGAFLSAVPRRG